MFNALIIRKDEQQAKPQVALEQADEQQLPEGNVTVRVGWTTMNYKDALAITGASPVVRSFPMVPGIDFAGTVVESSDPAYQKGDQVVLNGWGVGEKHWGGMAELARVPGEWLVPLQAPFTQKAGHGHRYRRLHRHALCIGTGKTRHYARLWSGAGDRGGRWCGQCRGRLVGQAGLSGDGHDRSGTGS